MEELEDTTEKLKEIQEELNENEKKEKWTLLVALTTAIISVLAAITGLFANHHANEAVIDQINSSDRWAQYQSKSIKLNIEKSTATILTAMGKPIEKESADKTEQYEKDKEAIKDDATEKEKESKHHLAIHVVLSRAVTIFQVAIAISAIAIVTRRKWLWYGSMLLMAFGVYFMIVGFFTI